MTRTATHRKTALMLPGGGARGAYQVGVLKALAEYLPGPASPFRIIAGTSAGAINAAVMASHAENFVEGCARLEHYWGNFRCHHIYRVGWGHNLLTGLHWLASLTLGGLGVANPRALFDTAPLKTLLERELDTGGIQRAIDADYIDALLVTASSYATSSAVTFIHGKPGLPEWQLYRRTGRHERITAQHLLASAALPLLFPARRIGNEYYGDGGMRHTTPLSPPIHLGAERILIIGTRDARQDPAPTQPMHYPTLGEIGGYLLDVIFMDYLHNDLARLRRINRTLGFVPPASRPETGLRHVEAVLIQPSADLRVIANRHLHRIPASVRTLLKGVGAWGPGRLPSYLLFEAEFCRELMDLGYQDGMQARDQVERLFEP
ncbi:MAG: patatin-like phospholipase family protein [Wenzhouxiangellaceae bacterium]